MIMRTKLLLIFVGLTLSMTIEACNNKNSERIHQEICSFLNQYCQTHPHHSDIQKDAPFVMQSFEIPAKSYYDIPKPLARLIKSFDKNRKQSVSYLKYDADFNRPILNTYYIVFDENGGKQSFYQLSWQSYWNEENKDSAGYHIIGSVVDGYRCAKKADYYSPDSTNLLTGFVSGLNKEIFDRYMQRTSEKRNIQHVNQTNTVDGDVLLAQIIRLSQLFDRISKGNIFNTIDFSNAAVLALGKLCQNFSGVLTVDQITKANVYFHELVNKIPNASRNEDMKENVILAYKTLYQKSEKYDGIRNSDYVLNGLSDYFTLWNVFQAPSLKNIDIPNFVDAGDYYDKEKQVKFSLLGSTSPLVTSVTISNITADPLKKKEYSVVVNGGKFSFENIMYNNEIIKVNDGIGHEMAFIVDSIPIKINMLNGVAAGSELNNKLFIYQRQIDSLVDELGKCSHYQDNAIYDSKGFKRVLDEVTKIHVDAIRNNVDNMISVYLMNNIYKHLDIKILQNLFEMKYMYSNHPLMQNVQHYYDALESLKPGAEITDFTCKDIHDKQHKLSEYVGKGYVLLSFWSDNVLLKGQSSIYYLKFLHKAYNNKGLKVVSVSLNPNTKKWKDFVKREGLTWTNLTSSHVPQAYLLSNDYQNILIGPDGRIIDSNIKTYNLNDTVWTYVGNRKPGMKYTDIECTDTMDVKHKLSEYVGKGYVMILYWSSKNMSQRVNFAYWKSLYNKYKDKGLQIIGISLDKDKNEWMSFIRDNKLPWVQWSDFRQWDSPAVKAYDIPEAPSYILIGPDGKIIANDNHLFDIFYNKGIGPLEKFHDK